jgi:hypothetical protein
MKLNPNADPINEKHHAYDAAAALLAKQDDASLRYAALELRRCIEAIVYAKLKVYGDLLPEGSVHQWQPPRAFEALIAIEPCAEATFTYAIAPETEPGKISAGPYHTVGVDERPKAKWIKKTWQKLGFYLHADWPFAVHKPKSSPRQFLEKTLADIGPLVNNDFSSMLSMKIHFECAGCGTTVKVMEKAVESSREAVCLTCGMLYRANKSGDSFSFIPGPPPFTCECGASTYVPFKDVKIGYRFSCRSCSRMFDVYGVEWKCAVADDTNASQAED